jgi:hypothetical protein
MSTVLKFYENSQRQKKQGARSTQNEHNPWQKTILLFSFSTRKARSFDKDIAEVEYAFTRIPFENGFSACK